MTLKKMIKAFMPRQLLDKRNDYMLNKQRERFQQGAKELLEYTDDVLNNAGIEYWLNYGTLLGAYREHDFIAHDFDLDIALYWKDYPKIKELMLSSGMKLKDEVHYGSWDTPENVEYRFEYKNAYVDFNFYTVNGNVASTYNPHFLDDVDYKVGKLIPVIAERLDNPFNGLSSIFFKGRKYCMPVNVEDYLIANYGKNFMKPDKNYNMYETATNIHAFGLKEKESYILIYY